MSLLPHNFKRIRLELARSKEHPNGSSRHGYEFIAPLDATHHIDAEEWKTHRNQCTVRRFWVGEKDENGMLVHKAGGKAGATWVFDYDNTASDDDEAGYRFGAHPFEQGEYVSIKDEDGDMHTFVVTSVENAS